jgi:hypothetical protein
LSDINFAEDNRDPTRVVRTFRTFVKSRPAAGYVSSLRYEPRQPRIDIHAPQLKTVQSA